MSLKVIAPPTAEPLALADAKLHLRVDGTDEDALITSLIVAARQGAEHLTGRALMAQTLELALDGFANVIKLPRPPLVSVASITYVDLAGTLQALATDQYTVDDHSEPARIVPAYGLCWPSARCQPNAVLVRYQAGYTAVPEAIKSWMLLRIGTLYEQRQEVVAGTNSTMAHADRLLDPYRTYL